VVEFLVDRCKCVADLCVVYEPADFRVHATANCHLADEGMAMKPFTFVTRRYSWQAMGGLEPELFYKFDYHSS